MANWKDHNKMILNNLALSCAATLQVLSPMFCTGVLALKPGLDLLVTYITLRYYDMGKRPFFVKTAALFTSFSEIPSYLIFPS